MTIIIIIGFAALVFASGYTIGHSVARSKMLTEINIEAYTKLSYQEMETFKKLFKKLNF